MTYEEHVSIEKLEAGETSGDTGPDGRRPPELPDKIVEPRCGDIVRFNHLDDRPYFHVVTTSRHEDSDNSYGFNEIGGSRSLNLSESELVGLFETDKSALWPVVYAEVDLFERRRDPETDGITSRGFGDGE